MAAVDGITAISSTLLNSLETAAPPRYREIEAAKARERSADGFRGNDRPAIRSPDLDVLPRAEPPVRVLRQASSDGSIVSRKEEAMPKGYWIVRVDIADQEKYKDYIAANAEPLGKYGARFLVRAGRFENPEEVEPEPQCRYRVSLVSGGRRLLEVSEYQRAI